MSRDATPRAPRVAVYARCSGGRGQESTAGQVRAARALAGRRGPVIIGEGKSPKGERQGC
jgi:hypothetical protein